MGCGSKILKHVIETQTELALSDSINFAGDSLFCEYAYVIDFDKNTFEIFKGFNENPLSKSERFYGFKTEDNEYFQVKHLKSFPLDNLPSEDKFLDTLNLLLKELNEI